MEQQGGSWRASALAFGYRRHPFEPAPARVRARAREREHAETSPALATPPTFMAGASFLTPSTHTSTRPCPAPSVLRSAAGLLTSAARHWTSSSGGSRNARSPRPLWRPPETSRHPFFAVPILRPKLAQFRQKLAICGQVWSTSAKHFYQIRPTGISADGGTFLSTVEQLLDNIGARWDGWG